MLLSDYFEKLATMHLHNTSIYSPNSPYLLNPNAFKKITYYINEGLTDLHTKFILLRKKCLIEITVPHVRYPIRKEYAETDPTVVDHKFIKDTPNDPFYPYLLKILNVIDEQTIRLPINDYNDLSSVFITEFDVVEFSFLNIGTFFQIVYQADHLPLSSINPTTQNIIIPPFLFEVLDHYILYKYFSDYLGQTNGYESQKHQLIYMNKIQEIKDNGLIISSDTDTNLKLEYKDFL